MKVGKDPPQVPVAPSLSFSLLGVQLASTAGRGGLLKDISFANVTILGTLFGIFKGGSYFGARKAESAFFLHMVIIVLITAAVYRLIIIMQPVLSFIDDCRCIILPWFIYHSHLLLLCE